MRAIRTADVDSEEAYVQCIVQKTGNSRQSDGEKKNLFIVVSYEIDLSPLLSMLLFFLLFSDFISKKKELPNSTKE